MAADKSPHGGEIIVEVRGAAGIVTLNRPLARNALSIPMRAALADAFPRFARDPIVYAVVIRSAVPGAFSVGGDVAEITRLGRSDPATARKGLADELRLSWRHECFTKPTASLIDGPVMGTGVGISLYGTHRIAGEGYRFAMPEVRIGYFPDCGVMHAFARMPRHIGRYLALTGRTIDRADAYFLKLATHTIDSRHFPDIEASLAAADPIDPVLDTRHRDPGPSRIAEEAGRIESMFSGRRVADIIAALEAVGGDGRAWAEGVLGDLRRAPPLALEVTDAYLRRAGALDLRETLEMDYRLACRFITAHDFHEGVRALLIDKDGRPRWQPARLEDVSPAMIDACFAPLETGELGLKSRAVMQAERY